MIHTATIDRTTKGLTVTLVHSFTPEMLIYMENPEFDLDQYIQGRGDVMKEILEQELRKILTCEPHLPTY